MSAGVRRVTLNAGGITLSALLKEPPGETRAVVVALHGGGMTAGYFDGQAHPDLSLLSLGARLGYTVLAIDRPGYGDSSAALPEGQSRGEQATTVRAALADFTARRRTGAGVFLLAHSYGAKVALTLAASAAPSEFLGLDISGCARRYALSRSEIDAGLSDSRSSRHWGPSSLYPPGALQACATVVAPMPQRERRDVVSWPAVFPAVAARVGVPLRLTFAEHESWWRHDKRAVLELTGHLRSPRLVFDSQPGAGHNMSLGWAARSYHLRALAFVQDCVTSRAEATPGAVLAAGPMMEMAMDRVGT
ncbi:MAG TPA: alpha/beta fold hydrolase [Jatrophihabitans sp.]|jgi:pimeloyl-ACP methyl ester carboxylesterase|uniref:alpha/beta hydrolase n=1 Tax=Jatrophihabitans sp. TaxID=1932789 RepID=UPI002F1DB417